MHGLMRASLHILLSWITQHRTQDSYYGVSGWIRHYLRKEKAMIPAF